MARLELEDGSSVPVTDGLTIGRIARCGLVLDDEKVSRKHARIVVLSGVAEVEDLGSRNGVFLNGHRVLRRVLRDGDVLTIGRQDLRFVDEAQAVVGPAGPAAGEDLLGEDAPPVGRTVEPTVDRTVEPTVESTGEPTVEPIVEPTAEPIVEPRAAPRIDADAEEPPAIAPRARPAAASRTPAPAPERDEVEVIEFVDEVVEVRKPVAGRPSTAAARPAGDRGRPGVLQFSANARAGVLDEDVGQLGGLRRALVVLGGLALAVGAAWGVMQLVS